MTETSVRPSANQLRHLSALRGCSPQELANIGAQLFVHEARKGEILLEIGATDDCTLYLLQGSCRLVAEDGAVKIVNHTDASARAPLARLRPSHYRVSAEGPVKFLCMANSLIDTVGSGFEQSSILSLESYEVEEEDEISHLDAENRLTLQIYEDLNADRLLLPSLPRVAIRIGEAVSDDSSDARQVAELIETDPAIALKIVKAANSARFGGAAQIGTVADAVARLGLRNTHILVVTFAMRELFRTDSLPLQRRMLEFWEHSRKIAAYSQVLGRKVGGFNENEALLAGLTHDIGGLAVVGYARDYPEVTAVPQALESSIAALRSQLGGMILAKWKMPQELATAAKEAENWYRDHAGAPDYADLVIVAQLHEGIGGDVDPQTVPALKRLGLSPTEIDRGLDLLRHASEEVDAAKSLLST